MVSAVLSVMTRIWTSPWGRTITIGIMIFMFGVVKGWGWAAAGRDAAIERAILARDAYWQQTIQKANDEHEKEIRKAIEASQQVPAARTRDELDRLCRDPEGGADCRDADRIRLQGVPSN